MNITVPDTWATKFDAFQIAEDVLRVRFKEDRVSRLAISQAFAAFAGVSAVWDDPAFRVWAALRGCVKTSDFIDRWNTESKEPQAVTVAE